MKIESADGQEGILIWCGSDRYVFRVYTAPPEEFVDYDICHTDMRVVIRDLDAYFYTDETGARVDHAPTTLEIQQ